MEPWNLVRVLVSKKKKRYQKDGFNLDLSYITPRIIAMGFPSEGNESLYRNPMSEVNKFMLKYHKDHYRVYNLCSERFYAEKTFGGNFARFPFDDHQAPPYPMIREFCLDAHAWLSQHPANVFVAHCKAGKGRTGQMICCYLMFAAMRLPMGDPLKFTSAHDALHFYAQKRTKNEKGVTIASQRRYISYFTQQLTDQLAQVGGPSGVLAPPDAPALRPCVFNTLAVQNVPRELDIIVLLLQRSNDEGVMRQSMRSRSEHIKHLGELKPICCTVPTKAMPTANTDVHYNIESKNFVVRPHAPPIITGDVKIEIYEKSVSKANMLAYTWFNTAFLPLNGAICPYTLKREELDKVRKSLRGDISLSLTFRDQPSDPNAVVIAGGLVTPNTSVSTDHATTRSLFSTSPPASPTPGLAPTHTKPVPSNLGRPPISASDESNGSGRASAPNPEDASPETPLQARLRRKMEQTVGAESASRNSPAGPSLDTSQETRKFSIDEGMSHSGKHTNTQLENVESTTITSHPISKCDTVSSITGTLTPNESNACFEETHAGHFVSPAANGEVPNAQVDPLPSFEKIMRELQVSIGHVERMVASLRDEEIAARSMHDHLGIVMNKLQHVIGNQMMLTTPRQE